MEEICVQGFGGKTWGKETTWKTLGMDGRIILKRVFESGMGGMEGINLANDRDRWRALETSAINLRVP